FERQWARQIRIGGPSDRLSPVAQTTPVPKSAPPRTQRARRTINASPVLCRQKKCFSNTSGNASICRAAAETAAGVLVVKPDFVDQLARLLAVLGNLGQGKGIDHQFT